LALIERSGVTLKLRPVMPMLMRGVTAPQAKQRYIITDSGREGRFHQSPLGRIVDPFGEPVKQAFNLYAGADALGQGMDFVTAYLAAGWQQGIDITTTQGLQQVASNAGIDWQQMTDAADKNDWETLLDDNLQALTEANLWGVPSFRVSGGSNPEPFACWGQDRIWRVEDEIAQRVG
jgi:2-hydroxychromene-2-carboxylate isomerase